MTPELNTRKRGVTLSRLPYFVSDYEKDLFFGRYADPGNDEEKTWEHVFERVSTAVAFDTVGPVSFKRHLAQKFYEMMETATAIPSSPQLWNYGANRRFPRNGSSCFTGRMGDTLKDFHRADSDAEDVYVASGGFGLLLDEVRPRGCKIKHCSEGAMGSMCLGGPARRIEGTTGYITGSGRARGALMLQQSIWHPDVIEFILAKRPTCRGWLDDWPTNAKSMIVLPDGDDELTLYTTMCTNLVISLFTTDFVHQKEWPTRDEFIDRGITHGHREDDILFGLNLLMKAKVLKPEGHKLVPQVYDYGTGLIREANRDWDLPMQNCNMSVRCSDEFMKAVEKDLPWVLAFFDRDPPKEGESSWTKIDVNGQLTEVEDGSWFEVSDDGTEVEHFLGYDGDLPGTYRYGVVLTTWEGLRANMTPNKNQWRDTDYARFYRNVIIPCTEKYTGRIMARQIWDLINENAWNHADPGVVFSGTYERFQPVDSEVYGPRLSNPCSEYVNSAGGSCNLISVNLRRASEQFPWEYMADHEWPESGLETEQHWLDIRDSSYIQAYLDEVHKAASDAMEYISYALEYNEAPVDYIHEMTSKHFRTVGVGIMGLAEALMRFHIRYGSKCAEYFAAATMSEVSLACWEKSFELAMVDGWVKPQGWSTDRMVSIFDARQTNSSKYLGPQTHAIRWSELVNRVLNGSYATHTCVTSVAPTGTISMIAKFQMSRAASNGVYNHREVTSGIEPPFFWGVARQDSSGSDTNFHDIYQTPEHNGKPWMKTAMDVAAEEHVMMQAAVTAFCCMSVSKTINLVESATIDDVKNGYMLAWKTGVPGTSLYRDRCKPMQVLTALECPSGECAVDLSSLNVEEAEVDDATSYAGIEITEIPF